MEDNQNENKEIKDKDPEDDATEDLVWEDDGETEGDRIKKLREKLKICDKERAEYLNGWQRAKADYVNARKEDEKNRGEFIRLANKEILLDMIVVADSFDQARANKEAWEKVEKDWRIGVEYIESQMLSVFERHGLKQINPIGEKFNPAEHASVGVVPTKNAEDDGKIVAVVQKGYALQDLQIRSPKVEVAVCGG